MLKGHWHENELPRVGYEPTTSPLHVECSNHLISKSISSSRKNTFLLWRVKKTKHNNIPLLVSTIVIILMVLRGSRSRGFFYSWLYSGIICRKSYENWRPQDSMRKSFHCSDIKHDAFYEKIVFPYRTVSETYRCYHAR